MDCLPEDAWKTAIVKYTDANTPYNIMEEKAFDGEIFMISTAVDEDKRLIL